MRCVPKANPCCTMEKERGFWNQVTLFANSPLKACIYSPVKGDNKTYHAGMP